MKRREKRWRWSGLVGTFGPEVNPEGLLEEELSCGRGGMPRQPKAPPFGGFSGIYDLFGWSECRYGFALGLRALLQASGWGDF